MNESIFHWYSSGTTQRRMAKVLAVNRKTVVRKFLFMAGLAKLAHQAKIEGRGIQTRVVQFDEMETFEHTRLKPLSIALAVEASTGLIIGAEVSSMSAKGKLALISKLKYGHRPDTRNQGRVRVLKTIEKLSNNEPLIIVTDFHPAYPSLIKTVLPQAGLRQVTRLAKRDVWVRRNPHDEMFALNHTAAKLRHDLSRMARKVWVTTKKAPRLKAHLDLYIAYHNGYALT